MSQPTEQTQIETVDDEAEFEPLKDFENDYEIQKEFPFVIKNKKTERILKETIRNDGYVQIYLNGKIYLKHILVANQFLENPDNLPQVDHINHNRTDNRLENLRFVSPSENCRNKSSNKGVQYEFIDDIPDEAIVFDEYNGHEFTDYFFHDDIFYFFNGIQYRKLHVNQRKDNGHLFVYMIDQNNKKVQVSISKFKRVYDLL